MEENRTDKSSLNETPRAERLHIGFYGRMNSGKSSLINAFAGQEISIVSDVAGTTTDPVMKSMEIHGLAPAYWWIRRDMTMTGRWAASGWS